LGEDYVDAGPGDDLIRAVDSNKDRFYCGDGNDTAYYDLTDAFADTFLADDCEVRIAVGTPSPTPSPTPSSMPIP
jgi:hypothetical protein